MSNLTLIVPGGGGDHHPLLENSNFSGTEPPLDLKPVCIFKFVHCGPVEKKSRTRAEGCGAFY